MYDSKYCKVLTIACCGIQSEDGVAQIFFWKNLNSVTSENGVSKANLKDFMMDNAHANWNVVRKIYGVGVPRLPMVGRKRTCRYHWSLSFYKGTHKYIKTFLQFITISQTTMQGSQRRDIN